MLCLSQSTLRGFLIVLVALVFEVTHDEAELQ
jgi:hypothetical protein